MLKGLLYVAVLWAYLGSIAGLCWYFNNPGPLLVLPITALTIMAFVLGDDS